MRTTCTPPLKWVGSKRSSIEELIKHAPGFSGDYYEPFLGGGSLFFALPIVGRAVLSDTNEALIGFYNVLKYEATALLDALEALERERRSMLDREFFLLVREKFNLSIEDEPAIERAALFYTINKMGFNGLWRVNRAGRCNVPPGKPAGKNPFPPLTSAAPDLLAASAKLQGATVMPADFRTTIHGVRPGDLVYFDPPYLPVSDTADFTSYTKDGFDSKDHLGLFALACSLVERGVAVVASNSPPARALWEQGPFSIFEVACRRSVNSKASGRGAVGELLIVGR